MQAHARPPRRTSATGPGHELPYRLSSAYATGRTGHLDQRRYARSYLRIYFEKLAMAADSVGKTSNTVTSLVTCRIS